jgi:hypothetical protein
MGQPCGLVPHQRHRLGIHADLLEAAGVDTVAELSLRNAENLADKLRAVNEVKQKVRNMPGTELIEEWILKAKSMPKAVEY